MGPAQKGQKHLLPFHRAGPEMIDENFKEMFVRSFTSGNKAVRTVALWTWFLLQINTETMVLSRSIVMCVPCFVFAVTGDG